MASIFLLAFTFITRIAGIFFLVAAGFSIPQAWQLNEGEYTKGGSNNETLYVPLEICDKPSISVDGQVVVFATKNENSTVRDSSCHTMEYLINACVASIFFSGVAMIVFFLFDCLARRKVGPVSRSSVLGMSLFMTFILIQTGACCYALYKECYYWEDYFMDRFDELDTDQFKDVKTYGDKRYFYVTFLLALACAGLLFLDTLFSFCAGDGKSSSNDRENKRATNNASAAATPPEQAPQQQQQPSSQQSVAGASTDMYQSSDDGYSFAQETVQSESVDPKKWTNY